VVVLEQTPSTAATMKLARDEKRRWQGGNSHETRDGAGQGARRAVAHRCKGVAWNEMKCKLTQQEEWVFLFFF